MAEFRDLIRRSGVLNGMTAVAALSAFLLSACGGGGGGTSGDGDGNDPMDGKLRVSTYGDLPGCDASLDGETAVVEAEDAEYACEDGQWRPVVDSSSLHGLELEMGRACSGENEGEIALMPDWPANDPDSYYICRGGFWSAPSHLEVDTYGWSAESDGTVKEGRVTAAFYKYDSTQASWLETDDADVDLGFGGCTQGREREVGKVYDDEYYICSDGRWRESTFAQYDAYGNPCGKNAELVAGTVVGTNLYVCDADTFRAATNLERAVGHGCTSYNRNEEISMAGGMRCSNAWNATTDDIVKGTLTDDRDGQTYKTVGIGPFTWMAENQNHDYKIADSSYGSRCYNDSAHYCARYGRLYTWAAAMDSATTGCGSYEDCDVSGKVRGVCPSGWHLPDAAEWEVLFDVVDERRQDDDWTTSGGKLKSAGGWIADCGGGANEDRYGFSAIGAGFMDRWIGIWNLNDVFVHADTTAVFWSSSKGDWLWDSYNGEGSGGYAATLFCSGMADIEEEYTSHALSVRCVKD